MLRRRGEPVRADGMGQWLDHLRSAYAMRTLDVDEAVALRWGELAGQHQNLPPIDGMLAATALVHGFTLVTRNVRDVAQTGVAVLNPWEA